MEKSVSYDYAIHSDYLIHWTGKDIDRVHDNKWYESDKSATVGSIELENAYLNRLRDILKYGLWMTQEPATELIPATPKCCFTELKISESRRHARRYGRLGIGVKRPFLFKRFGRPIVYFGIDERPFDKLLQACANELKNKDMMNFFKPMNEGRPLTYDLYGESEWRIIFFEELAKSKIIIDPRNPENRKEHEYFQSLTEDQQKTLRYLISLDGWFQMIVYPSLGIKNRAQQNDVENIMCEIKRIKTLQDHGNAVERGNWPIELDLDACRNF